MPEASTTIYNLARRKASVRTLRMVAAGAGVNEPLRSAWRRLMDGYRRLRFGADWALSPETIRSAGVHPNILRNQPEQNLICPSRDLAR